MALLIRIPIIVALGMIAGCPGDDSATSTGGQGSSTGSSTGVATTPGSTSTSTPTSDGSGDSGDASSGGSATTDATSTTAGTSTGGDDTGTTGAAGRCHGLDEMACMADPACMGLTGQAIVPDPEGAGFCYGVPQFLFCLDAGAPCLPATQTVCMGDMVYEAWSECGLPPGWEACAPPGDVNGDC